MENPSSPEEIYDQIQTVKKDLEELRSQMERIGMERVGTELGLLSKEVIKASQKLDEKINQYMLLTKQYKQMKDTKKPTT